MKTRCRAEPGGCRASEHVTAALYTRQYTADSYLSQEAMPCGGYSWKLEVHGMFPLVVQDGGKKRTRA